MFGRATITLGIGPHSSLLCFFNVDIDDDDDDDGFYSCMLVCLCACLLWSPYGIGQTIIFMVALRNRADHYIFIPFLSSSSSSSFFFLA